MTRKSRRNKEPIPEVTLRLDQPQVKKRWRQFISIWSNIWQNKGIKYFIYIIVNFATVISCVYFFTPKLDIAIVSHSSSNNPFPVHFIVTNQSELPVKNIMIAYFTPNVEYTVPNIKIKESTMIPTMVDELLSKESTTAICVGPLPSPCIPLPIISADLYVMIQYTPFLYPFRQHKTQRFVFYRDKTGYSSWVPRSLAMSSPDLRDWDKRASPADFAPGGAEDVSPKH